MKPTCINQIENKYNSDIKDLLYQMHWAEDMMHKEIGRILDVSRPTITRWFRELNIPTQSCHRITDKNLISWLYKTGKLEEKIRIKGPDKRIQRTKQNVNIDFFKEWTKDMAYVLGFFAADGGLFINSEGSKYIQFVSTDREILVKIKKLMNSNHKIGVKKRNPKSFGREWKKCYLIQIGSKEMYEDLMELGFTDNKKKSLNFPRVPKAYLRHFVRGFFDGDGCISYGYYNRKDRNNEISLYFQSKFTSGSKKFLEELSKKLADYAGIIGSSICRQTQGWNLSYSKGDSMRLFNYMYRKVERDKYLERKYNNFKEVIEICGDVVQSE